MVGKMEYKRYEGVLIDKVSKEIRDASQRFGGFHNLSRDAERRISYGTSSGASCSGVNLSLRDVGVEGEYSHRTGDSVVVYVVSSENAKRLDEMFGELDDG